MNRFYKSWLATACEKAEASGLRWNPEFCGESGKIDPQQRWNLTKLVGLTPPPTHWLSQFSHVEDDILALQSIRGARGEDFHSTAVMPPAWREFMQAALVHVLIVRRNKVTQAVAVARAIRTLSLCAGGVNPWEITAADVQIAYNVALRTAGSGKLALNIRMVVRMMFDNEHLAERAPLCQYAAPYQDVISRAAEEVAIKQKKRENSNYNVHHKRSKLSDRKSAERLPEKRAFWELIRIIFTETPQTFTDRIRFGILKMLVANGLRIGENILIPVNWSRWSDHLDSRGRPAGDSGGISRSLSLRYFGLKQNTNDIGSGVRLVECFQDVPAIYESLIRETMEQILDCTAPLRARLKLQTETGRLMPEYAPDHLVNAAEMYRHIAGSIRITDEAIPEEDLEFYRASHSVEVLRKIRTEQDALALRLPLVPVYRYWNSQPGAPVMRDCWGSPVKGRADYTRSFFRVGEVEDFVRRRLPTKLPDTDSLIGPDGHPVYTHQLAFLHPSRSLIEGRNNGLVDIEKYIAVGRISAYDLQLQLSGTKAGLFARYGETEEDRSLALTSHSSRHLQNGELFRLGVADTMITKRFNRSATSQSRTYDHRSLAEELEAIALPSLAEAIVPERAHETLRLIMAGKVQGPLVTEFLEIQKSSGDQMAFEYLAAEADGLHVTPYGFCLNSFTVDPCPKHLQCFNGCRHLGRTDNPEEQKNLIILAERVTVALAKAKASPARTIGRKNQVAHAEAILANVNATLDAAPGKRPFPEGADLSEPIGEPVTVIDAALGARS